MDLQAFAKVEGAPPKKAVFLRPERKASHLAMSIPLWEELGSPESCGLYVNKDGRQIALNFSEDAYKITTTKASEVTKKKSEAIVRKGKVAFNGLDMTNGQKEYSIAQDDGHTWLVIEIGDPNEPGEDEAGVSEGNTAEEDGAPG